MIHGCTPSTTHISRVGGMPQHEPCELEALESSMNHGLYSYATTQERRQAMVLTLAYPTCRGGIVIIVKQFA